MKSLEYKTHDSKREMEILDALDDIKQYNKRKAQIGHDQLLDVMLKHYEEDEEEAKEGREAVKEMFRVAKERELEKSEENKTKEINKVLSEFAKPETKGASVLAAGEVKTNSFGPKITIKPKKVKTQEESLNNGQTNLVADKEKPEAKKPALNLCSYSDDDE